MKVVFLIDSGLSSCENSHHYHEIIIVALRLLSFFSSRVKDASHNSPSKNTSRSSSKRHQSVTNEEENLKSCLQWGHKFFSSQGTVVRSKVLRRAASLSFNRTCDHETFHNFQKKVDLIFQNERETANKRNSFTHPSEQLATALTEILHDFEWKDKSDFSKSLGRSLRKRHSVHNLEEETVQKTNFVFILSKVPSSKPSLRRFSNKVVIDSDVFIDSFMSPALLKEYKEKLFINVHWIDLNCPSDESVDLLHKNTRSESLHIVKESLKKLGGDLLHKNDILNEFLCNPNLPYFKEMYPPIRLCSMESRILQCISSSERPDFLNTDINDACFVSGSLKLELAGAKLNPLVTSSVLNVSDKSENISAGDFTLDLNASDIELCGCISTAAVADIVTNLDIHQSSLLTCDKHSKLSLLLGLLIRCQQLSVLKITRNDGKCSPVMAVLVALTSTCGHIFSTTWFQQVNIEKAFLFSMNDPEKHHSQSDSFSNVCKIKKSGEGTKSSTSVSSVSRFNSQVLNSWHKPGSTQQLAHLISDLKSRTDEQSSNSVKTILADVKKLYMKAKQQRDLLKQQQSTVKTSTPVSVSGASVIKDRGSVESDSGSALTRRLSRQSSNSLSRGRLMVDKARSASLSVTGDEDGSNNSLTKPVSPGGGRRTSGSAGFESLNLKSEEELITYLHKQYNQVLGAGVAVEASIQAMVTVACYFMASNKAMSNPQKSAVSFLHEHLALDSSKLKEKIEKREEKDINAEIVEYRLQILLLLEMASFVTDTDGLQGDRLVGKLVSMLRGLSFIVGPTKLREFMGNTANSYCGTLPRTLMDVYDELDLPYPMCLAKLTSPAAPSTVWGANMSVGSVDSFVSAGSSQPPSSSGQLSQGNKRSRLIHHPSLSDLRQKKQILVDKPSVKPVSKTEGKKSDKDKGKHRMKGSKSRHGVDLGCAKRNLFADKSKTIKTKDRLQLTPKRKSGKPKLLVPGTPAHKQTSERMLSRQKRQRDHLNIKPKVQVVAESPLKDQEDPIGTLENKPARFLLRESFYSSNSRQSRIVAKSIEMAEKGDNLSVSSQRFLQSTKSRGSLSSAVRGESPILSPRTAMMRTFLLSPDSAAKSDGEKSPGTPRRSPRKSVKKLLFHNNTDLGRAKESRRDRSNKAHNISLDAQLIFDGENASDVLPSRSPVKHSRAMSMEGITTPKKSKHYGIELWQSASCPPLQVTPTKSKGKRMQASSSEISFKNIFHKNRSDDEGLCSSFYNSFQGKSMESSTMKKKTQTHTSSWSVNPPSGSVSITTTSSKIDEIRSDPLKTINSPIKGKKGVSANMRVSVSSFCFSTEKNSVHSVDSPSSSKKHAREMDENSEIILSTPKKLKCNSNTAQDHSTPGKVTFIDSCLISPPTGSGRPLPLTPGKSILKGSPAIKKQSFIRRIEMAQVEDLSINIPTTQNNTHPSPIISSNQRSSSGHGLQIRKSNLGCSPEKRPIRKPVAPNFDCESSSSNSFNSKDNIQGEGERPSASTVVIPHTPSPNKKSKTPDSINKWVRKKHHSGSRTVSSSSSSSSSVSPSSFSNVPSAEVPSDLLGNISQSDGKNLKRNLFTVNTTPGSSCSPRKKRKDSTNDQSGQIISLDTIDEETRTFGEIKNGKMVSHLSSGFIHNTESIQTDNESQSMPKIPILKSLSNSFSQMSSSPFKSMKGFAKRNSSFVGEGSQGFQMQGDRDALNEPSSSSGLVEVCPTESPPHSKSSSASGVIESPDKSNSKSSSSSTPAKKHFSPALSTSGLIQLMGSPLLEGQERQMMRGGKGGKCVTSRSRKHLDWPAP